MFFNIKTDKLKKLRSFTLIFKFIYKKNKANQFENQWQNVTLFKKKKRVGRQFLYLRKVYRRYF